MLKNIFKEVIIILLLLVAIIILLAILFYDYIPNSKTIPTKVEKYELAEDIKVELEKELNNTKSEEIIKTYQLDAIDLERYERNKQYNKGKVNPFAAYSSNPTTNNTTSGNGSESGNTSTGNSTGNTSSGTFLNTVGK